MVKRKGLQPIALEEWQTMVNSVCPGGNAERSGSHYWKRVFNNSIPQDELTMLNDLPSQRESATTIAGATLAFYRQRGQLPTPPVVVTKSPRDRRKG